MDEIKKGRVDLFSSNELIKERFRDMEDAYTREEHLYSIANYSVGLDSLLSGLYRSDIIVVAGRPGAGKSAFVHNITNHMAMRDVPVLLCSPEMCKEMVSLRLLSIKSKVSCKKMEYGIIEEKDWPILTTAAGILVSVALNINNTFPLPVSEIFKIASELKTNNKLGLLVIDSLPFISAEGNKPEDIAVTIMMDLKRLARNLNIPVILTVPLTAESPDTLQQIPCLNDIDSDRIVNIADVIILLHKITNPNKQKCKVEALVAKNRNGAQGIVPFYFFYQSLCFEVFSVKEQSSKIH